MKFIEDLLEKLSLFIQNNMWFAPLSAVLLPFVEALIPSLPLTLLIGFNLSIMASAFGNLQGTILTIVLSTLGSFLGMFLVFLLIRATLAPSFARKVEANKYGKMFLDVVRGPNLIPILMVMSNPFLPSSVLNYALSLTRTKTAKYLFLTITSRLIIVLFLVFLGSIFDIQSHPLNILWLFLAYLGIFAIWYVYYHHIRNKQDQ
ncbi:MAG: VTT domain-containing protein [Candidatus Izemoplasmatales bacterium]|nr:VTT domain-containing protein [Candidatus Izemoplasmatales bacterium]